MATGTIPTHLNAKYVGLGTNKLTTTTGSITSGSAVRVAYDDDLVIINYMIRITDPNGRPTITVSDFPKINHDISGSGNPTQARVGTTSYITDCSQLSHASGTTTATISMYNFIGEVPSGSGYLVLSGTIIGTVWA